MLRKRWFHAVVGSLLFLLMATRAIAAPAYSAWSPAASLESIPGSSTEVNTTYLDGCPVLSRDGLKLYLASTRPSPYGPSGIDIWVAERAALDAPFGTPVNVGAPINSPSNDFCPSPLRDGHGFLFVSDRPGACGGSGTDIYITRYKDGTGWEDPVNLGCQVNSAAEEAGPVLVFAEPGPPTLYFSSTRSGAGDLFLSQMTGNGTFGKAVPVPGVNTASAEGQPYVSKDGRELFFFSNREGGLGGNDIWSARRDAITAPWSAPVNLGPNVNSSANETRPSLSWDGTMLLFGTTRLPGVEGVSDIYYSTRSPLPDPVSSCTISQAERDASMRAWLSPEQEVLRHQTAAPASSSTISQAERDASMRAWLSPEQEVLKHRSPAASSGGTVSQAERDASMRAWLSPEQEVLKHCK